MGVAGPEQSVHANVTELLPRLPLFHLLSEQDCFPECAQQCWRCSGSLGWPSCCIPDAMKMAQLTSLLPASLENALSVSRLCFVSLLMLRDAKACSTTGRWNNALGDWHQGLACAPVLQSHFNKQAVFPEMLRHSQMPTYSPAALPPRVVLHPQHCLFTTPTRSMIDRDNHCNVQHRKAVQQFLLIQREASYLCFCRIHITPTGPWFCAVRWPGSAWINLFDDSSVGLGCWYICLGHDNLGGLPPAVVLKKRGWVSRQSSQIIQQ